MAKSEDRDKGASWWKNEPEISMQRQEELKKHLSEKAKLKEREEDLDYVPEARLMGMKLDRADIVYLLRTHNDNRGPVDPDKENREGLNLCRTNLRGIDLSKLPLASTIFAEAKLEDCLFFEADLRKSVFNEAHLENAKLEDADLTNSTLYDAHLEGTNLSNCKLGGATLRRAVFGHRTELLGANLTDRTHGTVHTCDLRWNDVNLSRVKDITSQLSTLGDEELAKAQEEGKQDEAAHFVAGNLYELASRANRQLALALLSQGLNDEAGYFSYKARRLQRKVYQNRHENGKRFVSWVLDIFAGYGYKPSRPLSWYIITVLGFAGAFYFISRSTQSLGIRGSFVLSVASALGRGFFPPNLPVNDPIAILGVTQGVIALFLEAMLIATFAKRFLEG